MDVLHEVGLACSVVSPNYSEDLGVLELSIWILKATLVGSGLEDLSSWAEDLPYGKTCPALVLEISPLARVAVMPSGGYVCPGHSRDLQRQNGEGLILVLIPRLVKRVNDATSVVSMAMLTS